MLEFTLIGIGVVLFLYLIFTLFMMWLNSEFTFIEVLVIFLVSNLIVWIVAGVGVWF